MSLHIPGMATETWFGANWVEGRKNGRPFFMNVITGETTHVRPRIQHQEQIAAITADQVLGDLPIQTPGKRTISAPRQISTSNSSRRGYGFGSNNVDIRGGGGSSLGGLHYAGAGAGSLYNPSPQRQQHNDAAKQRHEESLPGTLSEDDIDADATLGAFDDLDIINGVDFNNNNNDTSNNNNRSGNSYGNPNIPTLSSSPPFNPSFPPQSPLIPEMVIPDIRDT